MKMEKERELELIESPIFGRWQDEIYKKDPETGEIYLIKKTPWSENTIVENFGVLVAAFLAREYFIEGILFHAIGSGLVSFDTTLPIASSVQTALVTEEIRRSPSQLVFLDQYDQILPVGERSNIVQAQTIFDFTDGPAGGFQIREQGLFGGDATSIKDSGLMINAINHPRIFKDATIRLIRRIALEIRVPVVP